MIATAPDRRGCLAAWGWVVAVVGLAVVVKAGWLQPIDRAMAHWAQGARGPWLDEAAAAVTFFGSSPCAALVLVAIGVWGRRRGGASPVEPPGQSRGTAQTPRRGATSRPPGRVWAPYGGVGLLLAAGAAGLCLQVTLRLAVAQWRPDAAELPDAMTLWQRIDLAGFTSGHTFRSAYLYGWLSGVVRRQGTPVSTPGTLGLWLLIVAVGVTRVLLHRHWPSDVLGGWLVALAALSLSRCEPFARLVAGREKLRYTY